MQWKQTIKDRLIIPRYVNFDFLAKGLWIVSPPYLYMVYQGKYFSCYILTKFHCLIAFTSWDIGNLCICNCLFPRLRNHSKSIYAQFGNLSPPPPPFMLSYVSRRPPPPLLRFMYIFHLPLPPPPPPTHTQTNTLKNLLISEFW